MEERNKKQELTPKTIHSTRSKMISHFDEGALILNSEEIRFSPAHSSILSRNYIPGRTQIANRWYQQCIQV